MKKCLLALCMAPLLMQAAGIGVAVPFNIAERENIGYSDYDIQNTTYYYKPSTGLGFVFDTNVGKDSSFSYRVNLEYSYSKLDYASPSITSDLSKHKYSIINTFALSVYDDRTWRVWVAPRVIIQLESAEGGKDVRRFNTYGMGIAGVVGLNYRVSSKVALSLDLDYHGVAMLGGARLGSSNTYTLLDGSNKGPTARFYFLVKFGQESRDELVQPQAESMH